MAVTKAPIIPNTAPTLEEFDNAVALIADRLASEDNSTFWANRMAVVAAGLIKPTKLQMEAMKLMFEKKVPDAVKTIDVNNKTSVEVTIRNYLIENNNNFSNALSLAKDVTAKEEAITLALEQ